MKGQEKWKEHISQWRESGVSQTKFCQREKLTLSSFQYYKGLLKKEKQPSHFVELTSKDESLIEFVVSEKLVVRIPLSTSNKRISELVECLS